MLVLGIEDPQIWLAYVLCVLSALGCMVYGALNWKGEENRQSRVKLREQQFRISKLILGLRLTFTSGALLARLQKHQFNTILE